VRFVASVAGPSLEQTRLGRVHSGRRRGPVPCCCPGRRSR